MTKNSLVVCDGYVKYEEAEIDRSAIMQDFRNNGKKQLKMVDWRIFWILSVKFVMGYPCGRPYILLYLHGAAILLFFWSYINITKLFKIAAKRSFFNCFLTKLIRSGADIAEHICQIKIDLMETFS